MKRQRLCKRGVPGWLPMKQRPRCAWCGKAIPPYVHVDWPVNGVTGYLTGEMRPVQVIYPGVGGVFCRKPCAMEFGLAAFRAGFRRKIVTAT